MSLGYEVCIHRDGRWEVYSFFDGHEESDAIYQARDISNNYQAVCVLWSTEMRIVYFKSRNAKESSPKYMDVRSDLKLARKIVKPPVISRGVPKLKEKPKQDKKKKEDPYFPEKEKQKAIIYTTITGVVGILLTALSPLILSPGASGSFDNAIMFSTLLISSFFTYLVFQTIENASRKKYREEDIDCDDPWQKLGISNEVLEKLSQKQRPEIKDAIASAMPPLPETTLNDEYNEISLFDDMAISNEDKENNVDNVDTEIDKETTKENNEQLTASSSLEQTETSEQSETAQASGVAKDKEDSDKIKAAIAATPQSFALNEAAPSHDNSSFAIAGDNNEVNQETTPEAENALAEASLREVLTEMCRAIKESSFDESTEKLKDEHDLAAILYLCGAASYMVRHFSLPQKLVIETVPLILTRLNLNPEISNSFISQLSNYIYTPRHAIMFERGIAEAKNRTEIGSTEYTYTSALGKWQSSLLPNIDSKSFFATVMFTDIENFTESTRLNGDSWMIDVLHAHNDIIRRALQQFNGREIKHTGDGILAIFSNISKAVDAAVTIQRGIDYFNKAVPNRKFKLRIGLSAGDIISIDGDIFGDRVNLASRVMGSVDGGQIATTDNIYGICKDGDHKFKNLGAKKLKGYDEQDIYLIDWSEIST